ncbi:MAG: Glycosyl transferase group 1 [Parcubacteria group bacterium GW2011_GWC2_45_7]|nr:MAG: Glycosyl transferase group 1 [Parcubacteria group bacterium GW2011_GWC2_45_7]KKU73939.1 MAG: Glycosyl transferase group 1 [Parcubacteria group bacterium GW2011_GWA2_47_26]
MPKVLGIDASRAIKKEKTGVEWYSYFLLRAMEKCTPEGWKVRLYTPQMENEEWRMKNGNWEWKVLKWIGRGWTQGRLSLEMMFNKPDVLFVPAYTIPFVHPKNTVVTIHDVIFLLQPDLYDAADLKRQRRSLNMALKGARQIIVPSKATRDDLVHVGVKEERIAVIPHGVEKGDRPLFDSKRGLSPFSGFILFISRLEKKKNVLGLIRAFRRLIDNAPQPPLTLRGGDSLQANGGVTSDLKLILAGQLGYGGDEILHAINTLKLQDHVLHLGWTSREQYFELLKNAALLMLPSFGEGFGLPVLEAMAAGVPVVCSAIPALHEVGGEAAYYVDSQNSEDIARGMAEVLHNTKLRQEMISKGKERAREFSWDKAARETWNTITSLCIPLEAAVAIVAGHDIYAKDQFIKYK